ncbi:1864_t:CDS:2 [Funneliformis mosseae]|uniref:1864_t:CDS:1 n=1 Tax=Funneliformis mosseae TaxID=27381 RepID=A0A9N9F672_FUNMO|nr:1864_t:CDS:2 [Funneliformis mosseae]
MSKPMTESEAKEKFNDAFKEHVKKFNSKDADLKKFVQKLELNKLEYYEPLKVEDIKKFYEFVGPDFEWPSTSRISERRAIYDYINNPESGSLDKSKGSYILLINGKLVGYGHKLSGEEYLELEKKNPGMLYAPIKQMTVFIRFSSTASVTLKEWQMHMRIRRKSDSNNEVATLANVDRDTNNRNFRLLIDSGSTMTILPHFIRERMNNDYGWSKFPIRSSGYGENVEIYKANIPWEVSLGDGVIWTDWIETDEIFSWQKLVPNDIDCGLVGFDILNSTYQTKIPGRPYIFMTENNRFKFEICMLN